jgi:hypothetical protein
MKLRAADRPRAISAPGGAVSSSLGVRVRRGRDLAFAFLQPDWMMARRLGRVCRHGGV